MNVDKYTNIISKYKILFFSTYNNPYIALKNNNKYDEENKNIFVCSLFNRPLGNSLLNLIVLEQLILGPNLANFEVIDIWLLF